jgi:hypothetical protein
MRRGMKPTSRREAAPDDSLREIRESPQPARQILLFSILFLEARIFLLWARCG